jgi:hypothetical protein
MGIVLFAIYGFGSPAKKSFEEIVAIMRGEQISDAEDAPEYTPLRGKTREIESFTIVDDPEEEEEAVEMDFEDALTYTRPPDRYKYRSWSLSSNRQRHSADPYVLSHRPPTPTSSSKLSKEQFL